MFRRSSTGALVIVWVISMFGAFGCSEEDADPTIEDGGSQGDDRGASDGGTPMDTGSEEAGSDDSTTPDGGSPDLVPIDGGLEALPSAGYVVVEFQSFEDSYHFRWCFAEFYADYALEGDAEPPLPPLTGPEIEDECTQLPGTGGDPTVTGTVTYEYWDVGPQIAFSGRDEMHVVERTVQGDEIYYELYVVDFERRWAGGGVTIDIPGTPLLPGAIYRDVIDVPDTDFVTTSTIIRSPAGSPPLDFTWISAGAQYVAFFVLDQGDDGSSRPLCTCTVADDGAFTLPQTECLAAATGPGGLVVLASQQHYRDVEFNGRRLRIGGRLTEQINLARVTD